MLQPKRTKYGKQQKGKNKGLAYKGSKIAFGSFALKTTENACLLYTSPSPRDATLSRMPSSA